MSESIKAKNHLRSVMPGQSTAPVKPLRPRVKKQLSVQQATFAVQSVFELVGGMERFAIWADQNYDEFIKLWAKTLGPQITPTSTTAIQINVGNLRAESDGKTVPPE
jgi:hypothetical protein